MLFIYFYPFRRIIQAKFAGIFNIAVIVNLNAGTRDWK